MIASKYQVLRPINCGRYGSVYMVKNVDTNGLFAMKTLPKKRHDISAFINKIVIENETKNMEIVNGHKNIVRLHEVIQDEYAVHMIEELCGGHTLAESIVYSNDREDARSLLHALGNVIEAVRHCHQNDIVFGDLKPENVVFSTRDLVFKLTDFGSSVQVNPNTKLGVLFTTSPSIAAPEALESKTYPIIDFKYDVWSVGVLARSILLSQQKLQTDRDVASLLEAFARACLIADTKERMTSNQMYEFWEDIKIESNKQGLLLA